LALELSLLHEARPDVCESLTISRDHIRIRGGPAPLQAPFDIESCDLDPYAVLS
jgi:hypothetical protein